MLKTTINQVQEISLINENKEDLARYTLLPKNYDGYNRKIDVSYFQYQFAVHNSVLTNQKKAFQI